MKKHHVALAIATVAASFAGHSLAAEIPDEYSKHIQSAEAVGPLGVGLFGDQTNYYTGSTSFSATDVSIPGNFAIPVAAGRSFEVTARGAIKASGLFADWELEIPHLHGIFPKKSGTGIGWQAMVYQQPNQRCTVGSEITAMPPDAAGTQGGIFTASDYWAGNKLYIPGKGDQEMLVVAPENTGTKPTGTVWITNDQWVFSCITSTLPAGNAVPGEAFLATAPDGTKYWFNWFAKRATEHLTKSADDGPVDFAAGGEESFSKDGGETESLIGTTTALEREEVWILPSRIEDRLGNSVVYVYNATNPMRVESITASDGRVVSFTYNGNGHIATVSDGTRTWSYGYASSGSSYTLTSVTLPDASQWTFSLADLRNAHFNYSYVQGVNCLMPSSIGAGTHSGSITHPSGATGTFTVTRTRHGRGYVPNSTCNGLRKAALYPNFFDNLALTQKQISGPGLATSTWSIAYAPSSYTLADNCPNSSCPTTRTVTVTDPTGAWSRHTYGMKYRDNEGKLLLVESGTGTTTLRSDATVYLLNPAGQNYPARVGVSPNYRGEGAGERLEPVVARTTSLQGANFDYLVASTSGVYAFNYYGEPTNVTKASSNLSPVTFPRSPTPVTVTGYAKTEVTTFFHDTTKWVLNVPDAISCVGGPECGAGTVVRQVQYNADWLPWKVYSFGLLQHTLGYEMTLSGQKGTLKTVLDGNGHTTTYSNWKRGIPQLVTYPTSPATSESGVVNDLGRITALTDELGNKTCYDYDVMGRLSLVTYPSENTPGLCEAPTVPPAQPNNAWTQTSRSFVPVATAEYGIAAGHWRQTVQTGNGKTTTYYDAFWQPLVTKTEDIGTGSTSFVLNRYDALGRKTFSAYPVATLTGITDPLVGVTSTYDALGRPEQVQQHSELGTLTSTTSYLSGFRTQTTNARGNSTITTFQAWDAPSTDAPSRLELPEGVTTLIDREPSLGKPTAITRSGTYGGNPLSLTRNYGYDAYQRLCQATNPESGTTITDYDGASNVAWIAEGQAANASCATARAAVAAADKRSNTYDPRNRRLSVTSPDGNANVTTTYFADGAVATLAATNPGSNTITTTYTYNKRRLLTNEQLQVNALTPWQFPYAYNANGHLSSQTYPGNVVVGYAPDALGRPTQVGTFASNVTYHPNGAIAGFTYGNGIVHSMVQNARQLPAQSVDAWNGVKFLDDSYTYDANGNVMSLTDASAAPTLDNRTWGVVVGAPTVYDGLDRLISVRSTNQFGSLTGNYNALYAYDPLDNLRRNVLGSHDMAYAYDGLNRLASVNDGAVSTFGHDSRGRLTNDGRRSQAYVYDLANRMSEVTGKESYLYDGHGRRARTLYVSGQIEYYGYGQDGRLLQDWSNRRNVRNGYIYLGNTQVAQYEVNLLNGTVTTKYQHTDALGSPVAVTNASKGTLSRQSYSPYGRPIGTPTQDGAGYTGHFMDTGTGLTYMQQRYYDSQFGRFLAIDPMTTDPKSAWNFNRFSYVAGNPFKFKDPDGRVLDTVADAAFIAYDLHQLVKEPSWLNAGALAADCVGAAIPFATGLGMAVRASAHSADAAGAGSRLMTVIESNQAAKKADNFTGAKAEGYEKVIDTLASGAPGGNQHALKGDLAGKFAIDLPGSGKGRGAERVIYSKTDDGIVIEDIVDYHKK